MGGAASEAAGAGWRVSGGEEGVWAGSERGGAVSAEEGWAWDWAAEAGWASEKAAACLAAAETGLGWALAEG